MLRRILSVVVLRLDFSLHWRCKPPSQRYDITICGSDLISPNLCPWLLSTIRSLPISLSRISFATPFHEGELHAFQPFDPDATGEIVEEDLLAGMRRLRLELSATDAHR